MTVCALGLMSGTSMDGIDLSVIETDGESVIRGGAGLSFTYSLYRRSLLRQALADAKSLVDRNARVGVLAEAEEMVTACHIELVQEFLELGSVDKSAIAVIGFHGQTVLHRPQKGLTVQLGDGEELAAATGIPVVWDLRAADIAAGGQGAPLVPVYHQALVRSANLPRPVAVLNFGGVGNVTYIGEDNQLLAFDTGPGNALIDDIVMARTGMPMDKDGRLAQAGRVHEGLVERLLDHPYFSARPPKSLDRNAFSLELVTHMGVEDAAATLAAFTAASVAVAQKWFPRPPRRWIVCGGGAFNPVLMSELRVRLPGQVETCDGVGWSPSFLEAQAFAYLAVRSLRGLPLTYPSTTGVSHPLTGGRLSRPRHQALSR